VVHSGVKNLEECMMASQMRWWYSTTPPALAIILLASCQDPGSEAGFPPTGPTGPYGGSYFSVMDCQLAGDLCDYIDQGIGMLETHYVGFCQDLGQKLRELFNAEDRGFSSMPSQHARPGQLAMVIMDATGTYPIDANIYVDEAQVGSAGFSQDSWQLGRISAHEQMHLNHWQADHCPPPPPVDCVYQAYVGDC
jgi:hypothetical protein